MKQPGVLLAATLWWPLAARLATRLLYYGCRVSALCPAGHVLRHVEGLAPIYKYSAFNSLRALESAIGSTKPDFIIPCDDRVVWQLHELYVKRPHLRSLIEASLGSAAEFGIVAERERLLETARLLGVRVPETRRVDSVDDVRAWFQGGATQAVVKRDGTWGGDGVQIAHSESEGIAAYHRLARRPGVSVPAKRFLVNADPLAWWGWRRRAQAAITIQSFVAGRPANTMLACWHGELLGVATVEVLSSQGATGAAVVVRRIDNDEIAQAGHLLSQRLGLTGFYGLDFVIDRATGAPYLIEMNPRCTQLGHLVLSNQGDLAGLLCAKLMGQQSRPPPVPATNDMIAFFPQALRSHPSAALAFRSYLDVPWEHPSLVRELLLPSWPDRRMVARLYHFFHAPRKVATVEFDWPWPAEISPAVGATAEIEASLSPSGATDKKDPDSLTHAVHAVVTARS